MIRLVKALGLTASQYLDLDVLQGKVDHASVLDYLFLKQEGSGAIRRDPCPALPLEEK